METLTRLLSIVSDWKKNILLIEKKMKSLKTSKLDFKTQLWKIKKDISELYRVIQKADFSLDLIPTVKSWIENMNLEITQNEKAFYNAYNSEILVREINGKKIQGEFPEYRLDFILCIIDEKKMKSLFYFGKVSMAFLLRTCSVDTESIINTFSDLHSKITNREFNNDRLLNLIYENYKKIILSEGLPRSSEILVSRIFEEISKSDFYPTTDKKVLKLVLFSYDLFQMTNMSIDNHTLKLLTFIRTSKEEQKYLQLFWFIKAPATNQGERIDKLRFEQKGNSNEIK